MEQNDQNFKEVEHKLTKKEKKELRRKEKEAMRSQMKSKRTLKRALRWLSILIILGLAIFGMVKLFSLTPNGSGGIVTIDVNSSDWVEGNQNASTTIVEYSDFQCPACAVYYSVVKQLINDFGSDVRLIYRNLPLPQHQNADLAARVAGAAGKQGKFWEMHDVLFENQTAWAEQGNAEEIFIGYANSLGLNIDQFKQDIDSNDIENKIQDDIKSGISFGVDSTPSFFINGVKIQNPRSYDEFKSIIEQSIQLAQ